ncbi:hypothetical protein ACX80W_12320 [Arthrobacter sp. TMN-37]
MTHEPSRRGGRFSVDTSEVLLVALYLRDCSGLRGIGQPSLPPVRPAVRTSTLGRPVEDAGGTETLRVEWEAWWHRLVGGDLAAATLPIPPEFEELNGMVALRRVAQAHFGSAIEWAEERRAEYALHASARGDRLEALLDTLVEERELELGRAVRRFTLDIVELPLGAQRAWWVEPARVLMCQDLCEDEGALRSYVEPVIRMLA